MRRLLRLRVREMQRAKSPVLAGLFAYCNLSFKSFSISRAR